MNIKESYERVYACVNDNYVSAGLRISDLIYCTSLDYGYKKGALIMLDGTIQSSRFIHYIILNFPNHPRISVTLNAHLQLNCAYLDHQRGC